MNSKLIGALILGVLVLGKSAWAESSVTLLVGNLECRNCPEMFIKSLKQLNGVTIVKMSEKDNMATVSYDENQTDIASIVKASMFAGYPAKITNPAK